MTENDSQGGKWGFWKKALVFSPLIILAGVAILFALSVISFPQIYWSSANPPQPLDVAVAVLTILVAIAAVFASYMSLRTREDWYKFREKTDENWKNADKRFIAFEESQKGINYLNKHIKTDPLLQHDEDIKQLFDFADGFINGQDMLPLKYYFVGRAYENEYDRDISKEKRLEKSIQYYEKALECEMWPSNKRRVCQAMGFSLSELGDKYPEEKNQPKAKEYYEKAREAFHDADEAEHSSQALDSQGNACIKLAKMASDNKEVEAKLFTEAIKCFDDAIQMKDKLVRHWWATFHFDKARALALRADGYDSEHLDKVVEEVGEELNKTIDLVVPKPVGFDDLDKVFQDFKNVQDDNEIKRLLDLLRGVIRQARLKGD